MIPQHCGQPMYMDTYNGLYMKRWLCVNPGCMACISDDVLVQIQSESGAIVEVPINVIKFPSRPANED